MSNKNSDIENGVEPQKLSKVAAVKDATIDWFEALLDVLLKSDNELVKEIPLFKTAAAFIALTNKAQERFFQKKVIQFLNGFKDADEYMKQKIEEALPSQNDKEEMAEKLGFALQNYDQVTKADSLCKLFLARIYNKIDFNDLEFLILFYGSSSTELAQMGKPEFKDTLRTFLPFRLLSVKYSDRPTSGQLYPRAASDPDEIFIRTELGSQFIKALNFSPTANKSTL